MYKKQDYYLLQKFFFWLLLLTVNSSVFSQSPAKTASKPDTIDNLQAAHQATPNINAATKTSISGKRLGLVLGAHTAIWTGTYIALNKAWYANYPGSSFHFFNDNNEWEQMDKMGHCWTAYSIGRISSQSWEWAGLSGKKAVIYGGLSALAYQSIIEIQDGFSAEWGFSWGDMGANLIGASAFVAQELGWKEQRIQIKLSYWPYNYSSDLIARRNQLFGSSLPERILKDYNSQTYWFSANIHSFFPNSHLPAWLNIALGYSADGMLAGVVNKWTDKQGNIIDRTDIPRIRRFLLSPDIDLSKIKTRSKILKTVFYAFNILKIPAPAIELDGRGNFKLHALGY
jgi:hypothetical protein